MSALIETRGLVVEFELRRGLVATIRRRPRRRLRAVDRVDLEVERGRVLGLVGESGCGKSSLARAMVGLVEPTAGEVHFEGEPVGVERGPDLRRRAQMVFQDPTGSLNPSLTVERAISELLSVHDLIPADGVGARCRELLELVELPASALRARPRQLSGGQRQRVAIARALALEPDLLVADEAVAALDVSVKAAVINLLRHLQEELGLTLIFISHDLAVVRQLCDRIAIMYLGAVVEEGEADAVLRAPGHPYTRALLAAVPRFGEEPPTQELRGEPPSPLEVPPGCRFHPRCLIADPGLCPRVPPELEGARPHRASCHFAWRPKQKESRDHAAATDQLHRAT